GAAMQREKARKAFLKFTIGTLLLLWAVALTGCGLVADGVNHARAFQLDPGKLYSSEFYRTATPEEVKEVIGCRSLAGKSYTVKEYYKDTGGFLGDLKKALSVVLPASEVHKQTIYPLEIALRSTPYPEVIEILLEAGAELDEEDRSRYFSYGNHRPKNDKVLLLHYREQSFARNGLILYVRHNNREMVDFCLSLAETTSETPQKIIWTEKELLPALEAALGLKNVEMASYLLEQGATVPQNPKDQNALLSTALKNGNVDGFRLLLKHGADCSAEGRNNLLVNAITAGIKDESMLKLLANSVPMEGENASKALRALCSTGNTRLFDIALKRSGGMPTDPEQQLELLEAALKTKDLVFFKHLVSKGADCGAVDKSGDNDLMYTAYFRADKNAELMEFLAARVPVEGDNGRDALRYACKAGNLKAVRILLDRGIEPKEKYKIHMDEDVADAAAISELLLKHGF
ncbi:ankyrin repeat domain-containing protein, partial [Desulfococcaceae bacterium OttesenSCG-928-F15]|nr:ankyrin repeat domain-containing protein [Desulfococcaceae bacterium OttesenSCG-928-F15]